MSPLFDPDVPAADEAPDAAEPPPPPRCLPPFLPSARDPLDDFLPAAPTDDDLLPDDTPLTCCLDVFTFDDFPSFPAPALPPCDLRPLDGVLPSSERLAAVLVGPPVTPLAPAADGRPPASLPVSQPFPSSDFFEPESVVSLDATASSEPLLLSSPE